MKNYLYLLSTLFLFSCATVPDNPNAELVMTSGTVIEATTSQGTMQISYVDRLTRRYVWDGYDKTFRHQARQKRWYGSLGMYRPGGDGTMHAVLEEGQQHFSNYAEAKDWIAKQERFTDYVWTRDGLVVGWKQQGRPADGFLALHVDVWQVFIDGKKPTLLGASPSKIRRTATP
jgi:hypothetical protein